MALQTKTFSLGSFEWKNPVSNAYILDLIVTEESTDLSANTSQISYVLQLRSGSNNRFTGRLGASITLGGVEVERATSIGITAYYNHTYTLLSDITTIAHNDDGSFVLDVKANIWQAVSNSFAPPSMELTGTMTLTEIPRVSVPTVSPSPVAIGGVLTIRTNRKTDAFTHTLSYTFGETSGTIAENIGEVHDWPIPEALAAQMPDLVTGWGTLTCRTFNGETEIGSQSVAFAITVPQNETTKPQLTPELMPVNDGIPNTFADLYIQGKSRVRVLMNAAAWNSTIASQSIQLQGLSYSGEDPLESGLLLQSGVIGVTCTVVDYRGYSNSCTVNITVLPYRKPTVAPCSGLSDVICCRSDAEGNSDINGTRILLKARRSWHDLSGHNNCQLRYRIREEGGTWPTDWNTLLTETDADNEVKTVLEDLLNTKLSYQVQLSAVDTVGEEGILTMPIGTANTPLHIGRGGKNLGLGRYCNYDHTEAIDVGWAMYLDESINGMYLDTVKVSGTAFTVQSCFNSFDDTEMQWQALLLWGSCGGQMIHGTIGVSSSGSTTWAGSDGVSVVAAADGKFTVTIPQADGDQLILMSPHKFEIN